MMRRLGSFAAGLLLSAVTMAVVHPLRVSADHGYWPESGVKPATVTGHAPRTSANADPSAWGSGCESIDYEDGLDVYGAVLEADYGIAVVLAIRGGGSEEPLLGPNGATVFASPRQGEFVWADADGDGTFAGSHEADAGALFVCPEARPPATDEAAPSSAIAEHSGSALPGPTVPLLAAALSLWWIARRRSVVRAR
jgi:hypothetical protein